MYETLRRGFYWPSTVAAVYHMVWQCSSCARDRVAIRKRTNPLTNPLALFLARTPLESVERDNLSPLTKSRKGHLYILVMVDRFSKLCRVLKMRSMNAKKGRGRVMQ